MPVAVAYVGAGEEAKQERILVDKSVHEQHCYGVGACMPAQEPSGHPEAVCR
jgi:hypothetical protein